MRKKILMITLLIASLSLTSCKSSLLVREGQDEPSLETSSLEEPEEKEDLEPEEILDRVLKTSRMGDSLNIEYKTSYSYEFQGSVYSQEDLIDYYQDGQGNYKTLMNRQENGEAFKKFLVHKDNSYIFYDGQESDQELDLEEVWARIEKDENLSLKGLYLAKTKEEFEDLKDFDNIDIPTNPLVDGPSLLEIYNYSNIHSLLREKEKEREDDYVLRLKTEDASGDIIFKIDRESFLVKSYSGKNNSTNFTGEVLLIEEVAYGEDFFENPRSLKKKNI